MGAEVVGQVPAKAALPPQSDRRLDVANANAPGGDLVHVPRPVFAEHVIPIPELAVGGDLKSRFVLQLVVPALEGFLSDELVHEVLELLGQ